MSEFDKYAESYKELHQKSINFSGEETSYFTKIKVREFAHLLKDTQNSLEYVLDFGSGIGGALPFFKEYLNESKVCCVDVSSASLEYSKQKNISEKYDYRLIEGKKIPAKNEEFSVVYSACVFHHIDHDDHIEWCQELWRTAKVGARLVVFEHNPINPLTRKAVRDCPFDENAVLVSPKALKQTLIAAGWKNVSVHYIVFIPRFLSFLRFLEKYLKWCPFGAQYYVLGEK